MGKPIKELTMSVSESGNMVVALDIGTSKIVALIGEVNNGDLEIIGIGQCPSRGMKKGVVVNIDSTIESIQRAVEEAELMAGVNINSAYAGIAGSHIQSLNSHGIVAIKDKEVTESDLERVMDAARAVAIPADQRILHVLPQDYVIDQQEGIREPVGMSGVRLEARVHLVTGAQSAAQNIIKCVDHCGLDVRDQFEVFAGDIRDPHGVRKAMEGCEAVLHLAALIAIPYSYHSPDTYVDTNIKGTLNILQAARNSSAKKVIVTSTSEVYGTATCVPIDEGHPRQGNHLIQRQK